MAKGQNQNQWITSWLTITLMVSMIYAITGHLGLRLASGSPYSTAIWIPSGIALGAVLVFGLRALPGVFLGSLLINIQITAHGSLSILTFPPIIVGSTIASGAALQAYIGWLLIKKYIGLKNPLNEPNDILLFAFLTGPVACLVNATTSDIALLLMQILPQADFFTSWITWYIGDSIGVLIFTPIFLILFAEPRIIWRSRIIPILLPLMVCFTVVTIAYTAAKSHAELSNQLWFVLTCGLMFCVLINITLFIMHGQTNLAQLTMKAILRSAGEGIFAVDQNEMIFFVNPAVELMWQTKEGDFIGKSIHQYLDNIHEHYPNNHNNDCPIYKAYRHNHISQISNKLLLRNDGTSIWLEYTCTPLIVSDKTIGAVIIMNDITKRRESEFHLERMAHYDILTGLPNRFSFVETLKTAILQTNNEHINLSVLFLDLDNFKYVNDKLGHGAGDLALQNVSDVLAANIDEKHYFSRLGSDEFGIIAYYKDNQQEINLLAEKLIKALCRPIPVENAEINISISIGIATHPDGGKTADELIKSADIAMYRAKEMGKNTYTHFNEDLTVALTRFHKIETELRHSIARNELWLAYQPQIEAYTQKISGIEVLLRWNHPELGEVSPAEFIPIAEKNGMIHPIGAWVLQQLMVKYKEIAQSIARDVTISINVSVLQLSDPEFYTNIIKLLEATSLQNMLILEITETAFMSNPQEIIKNMDRMNKLGVYFALDDFGINYSSMRYLKSLPISQLKVDYIFVKDLMYDKNDLTIVSTIIQLSKALGIPTVAEGVETKAQLDLLKAMGCPYIQGFYFYKPLPLDELLLVLQKESQRL